MYLVFDLETSGKQTYRRFCNPLDQSHTITAAAMRIEGEEYVRILYNRNGLDRHSLFNNVDLTDITEIIGQNLKFDLLWIWSDPTFQRWLQNGGRVYDTYTAEYILSAQIPTVKKDLDSLAQRYKGTLKDDRIGQLFKQGVLAKDIDKDILLPYVENDVLNTEKVYLGQKDKISKQGFTNIINVYMEHYLAVCAMEYNGLYVDQATAERNLAVMKKEMDELFSSLGENVPKDWPDGVQFMPSNNNHISAALFGGHVRYIRKEVMQEDGQEVLFKSGAKKGQVRTRNVSYDDVIQGWEFPIPAGAEMKHKAHKCTAEIIQQVYNTGIESGTKSSDSQQMFIENLLKYKKLLKLVSTYYRHTEELTNGKIREVGMLTCVMPHSGCVHTEFKTAHTRTGRLSSGTPNIQNAPGAVRELFASRWGASGKILSIDYSQLEVRTQAYLTGAKKFLEDVNNGVDFHIKRMAFAHDLEYEEACRLVRTDPHWVAQRKAAKGISFAKAYDASPETIARNTGIDLAVVKKVFMKEDEEYPEIRQFNEMVKQEAEDHLIVSPNLAKFFDKKLLTFTEIPGEHARYGIYRSITGKKYAFEERCIIPIKSRQPFRFLNSPDIANYPNQGLAADIISLMGGLLYRKLAKHRDKCALVAEVHDEFVIDCKIEWVDFISKHVKLLLESAPQMIEKHYGIKCDVEFPVEVSTGNNWLECKGG